MGEEEWVVAVHGDDQVLIVVGQPQATELVDAVPLTGPDEDRAIGVDLADAADGLGPDRVDHLGRRGILGLVQQLERQARGRLPVVGRELLPDRQELRRLPLGVGGEVVEVVDVHDHAQALRQRRVDQLIGAREELGLDAVPGAGPV